MMTLTSFLFLGFFLGMRHATDADHVIAVSTIVTRERSIGQAALRGMFWGVGHTLTLMVVGGAILFFGLVIPKKLGLSLEFSVGVMLVLLGLSNLMSFRRWLRSSSRARSTVGNETQENPHSHNDFIHTHSHGHTPMTHGHDESRVPTTRLDSQLGTFQGYKVVRPLVVGIVHGLAGSAAVALLVLPLIQNAFWGVLYLSIFGVGTIAGMMLITATIATPLALTTRRFSTFHHGLGLTSGFVSVGFGALLIYEIGFVQGLFVR